MNDNWNSVCKWLESLGHTPASMESLELICDLAGMRPEAEIPLTHLECLSAFPRLKYLRIVGFEIESVECCASHLNLESVDLSFNALCSTQGMQNLSCLNKLFLQGNKLQEIGCIAHHEKLVELNLYLNRIKRIDHLGYKPDLRILNLTDNGLESLEGIEGSPNLEELYCWDNEITSLEPIRGLQKLRVLYCHENRISDFSVLESLPQLMKVDISNNPKPTN